MQNNRPFELFKYKDCRFISMSFLILFLSLITMSTLFCNPVQSFPYNSGWGLPYPLIQRSRPGEILIRFKLGTPPAQIANLIQQYGLQPVSSSPFSGIQRVAATANINGDLLQILRLQPEVMYAEANFIRRVEQFIPNDPLIAFQWHLNINDLPLAWELSSGQGVTVAVLDTGSSYENYGEFGLAPDLANTIFLPGWDFINSDGHPNDDNRHGTHITGIIAQSTNNLIGGAGVAFQSSIMPVKVLDNTGSGDVSVIVDGIYYAINNGAQIINLSFGSIADPSSTEEEAINYAVENGILVICSAGNEISNQRHYPSSYPGSISVTATRLDNKFAAAYANFGPDIDLAAPGGDLSLDQDGNGEPDGIYQQTHNGQNFKNFDFYYSEGTSSACAYVSGVAALVLSRGGGNLSVIQAREILESTAIDLGPSGWDEQYGWGVVNPFAAVLAVDALLSPRTAAAQGFLSPFLFSSIPQSLLLGSQIVSPYTPYSANANALSIIGSSLINSGVLNTFPATGNSLSNSAGFNTFSTTANILPLTRSMANNGVFTTNENLLPASAANLSLFSNNKNLFPLSAAGLGLGSLATLGLIYDTNFSFGPEIFPSSYMFPTARTANFLASSQRALSTSANSGINQIAGNYNTTLKPDIYSPLLWPSIAPNLFIPWLW